MSKPEFKNVLSQEGKTRKEAMLDQLQDELVSVHHKRRRRTVVAKGVALAAVVAIAGFAWSFLVPTAGSENRIVEGTTNMLVKPRVLVASVSNVEGIDDRCVVVNSDSSAEFEAMADEELLAMLAAIGQPSVLGEINGKVRLISDSAPVRKQVDAL